MSTLPSVPVWEWQRCRLYQFYIKFFNFIPDPFIRKFIEDEFYKYIYRPIFNYVFNKAIHFINYSCHKVREEFKYILRRLW